MGTRTEHAPGTFSWVDLTTSDAAAAKDFYGRLFGWDFEDNEIPGGGTYTMCKVNGDYVCAIPSSTDQAPPHWNSYVTVASADESAAKAKELGANLIEEPFDVMEAGRMALLQDPTGAALCVWEPRQAIGAGRVNEPGCLTWNELQTPDVDAAGSFYRELFAWTTQAMDTGEGPAYHVIRNGERSNGGITQAQPGQPASWIPYFAVDGLDGAISATTDGGGEILAGPIPMPQGKIAVLRDPQGAVFALWEGELDD
ncbi:MAG TPA: VOC family protein [Solirubrobacteraceae bacterium]